MNLKLEENKKQKTSQPTGGCRMRQARSFLLYLLAATFLITGLSFAAGVEVSPFSDSAAVVVTLNPITDTVVVDTSSYVDEVRQVTAGDTGIVIYKFVILNGSTISDTLTNVTIASMNDSASVFSHIALMKGDSAGPATELAEIASPGTFMKDSTLDLDGFNDAIATGESTFYYIVADISADVGDILHRTFAGIKIYQNGIVMDSAGAAPSVANDTLYYSDANTDDAITGDAGLGRTLQLDLLAPVLDINFTIGANDGGCIDNDYINIGDSVFVWVVDDSGNYLPTITTDMTVFGPEDSLMLGVYNPGTGNGRTLEIRIPDTVFAGADEFFPGQYALIVTATDAVGLSTTDTITGNDVYYHIDTKKPVIDDDSVWIELSGDINGDGTAAVGDTITVHANLTTEGIFELDSVIADLSAWQLSSRVLMHDQGIDNEWTAPVIIEDGTIDIEAVADSLDTSMVFYVRAYDKACNITLDSNDNAFDIDNELPEVASVEFELLEDDTTFNVANLRDVVKITITPDDSTTDLAATDAAHVDLQTSGLGGSSDQVMDEDGSDYVYEQTLVFIPRDAQYAVDEAAGTHTVEVTLTDDAGNVNDFTSSVLAEPIDTRPPDAVTLNYPEKGACAIDLTWIPNNNDDMLYQIYSDNGDGTWSSADLSNYLDIVPSPDTTWSTDEVTMTVEHGTTYQFRVRVIDDANNSEYFAIDSTMPVSGPADCEAPTACVDTTKTKSGGSYGGDNPLDLIVTSANLDINDVVVKVRDADNGFGVAGPWITIHDMTQIGSGGTFTYTLNDANLDALGNTSGYLDDTYELISVAYDDAGNYQTDSAAVLACEYSSPFTFHWFWEDLPARLVSVNDTISPQDPSCGFNVTRGASNEIAITVDGALNDTFIVDVQALGTGANYRVFYDDSVTSMPDTFNLNCTDFPKGSQTIYVTVTRNDGNETDFNFPICVPDENAPEARIIYPMDNEIVRRSCNTGNTLEVWAKRYYNTYDNDNTTRVEFFEAHYDSTVWTRFDIVTDPWHGRIYVANWNNCDYHHGDLVKLRAVYYDDYNNTDTTEYVVVQIDTAAPDIELSVPLAKTICNDDVIGGTIDLYATVNSSIEDIASVNFYYSNDEDPDLVDDGYYTLIGSSSAGTSNGIYLYSGFDTDDLTDGKHYRFRAIATDIAGNVMWDSDEDGVFDDNTFDPATKNSDLLLMVDNDAIIPAISNAVVINGVDTTTFPNPSSELSGSDRIYAVSGSDITVHSQPLPLNDTCGLFSVVYYWDENEIGVASTVAPYAITFDPVELGFIHPEDIAEEYQSGTLTVVFTDMFGNTSSDDITVYILDNTANQAVIFEPPYGACVSGEVELYSFAVNDYDLSYVEYYYRAAGDTGLGTYIGMSTDWEEDPVIWNTVNAGLEDGEYELAAVTVDESLNRDANPTYITVTLANTFVEAAITEPAEDYVYIAEGALVKVEETSGTAKRVEFMTKPLNSDSWTTFATDNEAPWEAEHDIDMIDGVCQIKARVYNCADEYKDTEIRSVYIDNVEPYAQLVTIGGYDAEGGNDPTIDLTGMEVVDVVGMFRDDDAISGFNSGIAKVAFYLTDDTGTNVRVKIIDPATAGTHTAQFDITGLDEGTYYFACRSWDAVGNMTTSGEVAVTISDVEVPVTAIAGYYSGMLYGYDWSGDAEAVLFEYQSDTEWIGIGIGYYLESDIWYANWVPAVGTYTLRMKAVDENDNYSETLNSPTTSFTYNADGTFSFASTGLTEMAAIKNYDNYHIYGVVGLNSALDEPFAFGIYIRNDGARDYEVIDLDANLDEEELYRGSFNASYIDGGGVGYIFASAPSGNNVLIQQTTLSAYQVTYDLGTNGTVRGNGNTVSLTIPPGGSNLVAFILKTWMPDPSVYEQYYDAIGNSDGLANYIGCNDDEGYCYLSNDRYATITMPYDTLVTTPAESLVVGRWDGDEWRISSGIYQPSFNTTNHTVTFKADQLYGLFAVLRYKDPTQPSPITIEFLPGYCEDTYDAYPTIKARVKDIYSGIDDEMFSVIVDGEAIILEGDRGDNYDYHYDDVTGILEICWYDDYEEYGDFAEALSCGNHSLILVAWNEQAQIDTATYDFVVDCVAPTVVFENSYVSKNPTIEFNVSDDLSGVDFSSIHVDVVAIQLNDTSGANPHQDENLFFLQTFFPDQLTVDENGDVTIPTTFELEDERAIVVIIYNGSRDGDEPVGDYYYGYGWDEYYADGNGIYDCVGNAANPHVQILGVDYDAPAVTVMSASDNPPTTYLSGCPAMLQIADDGSGVAATGVLIYEDGALLTASTDGEVDTEGEYSFNTTTGIIEYCPTPGSEIRMVITDRAGNQKIRAFRSFTPNEVVDVTVNYTPWDPKTDGYLTIDYKFPGTATIKIYDFGGDLVKSTTGTNGYATWNGRTEDGSTMVADGIYFAHILIETEAGSYSTVVKIAVVEE
jgi:hypothetical protein